MTFDAADLPPMPTSLLVRIDELSAEDGSVISERTNLSGTARIRDTRSAWIRPQALRNYTDRSRPFYLRLRRLKPPSVAARSEH